MANTNLFIYKLLNNVNARVTILGLSKDVVAYTTQDFGFSVSAQWSGREPNAFLNLANTIERSGVEGMNRLFGKKWGEMTTGMTLDVAGSLLNYQGTEPLGFVLNLHFIAIKSKDDVREKLGILNEGVSPTFGKGVGGLQRVYAPNAFKKGSSIDSIDGAVSVEIGQWFRTKQIFVITNMDFSISKETLPNGRPLYAKGTVSFKCARIMSADEIKSMFHLK
jgi:hypothetical protein